MAFNTPVAVYQSGAAPAGFDPTLGGTITPNYWWDLQDQTQFSLSGTDVNSMTSKGSATNGTMTTTTNGTKPQFTTDPSGNDGVLFSSAQQQRLGTNLVLIPWQQNVTVFIACHPIKKSSGLMCPFGHEGYTYSGNLAQFAQVDRTKASFNTQVFFNNNILYDYGSAGIIPKNGVWTDSRPLSQSSTGRYWVFQGYGGYTDAQMWGLMHTMVASRSWNGNDCTVENAFDSNNMINNYTTEWNPSTQPQDGTAIGQSGRPTLNRNPFNGYVYQVVVYYTVLSSAQITALRTSWLNNYTP